MLSESKRLDTGAAGPRLGNGTESIERHRAGQQTPMGQNARIGRARRKPWQNPSSPQTYRQIEVKKSVASPLGQAVQNPQRTLQRRGKARGGKLASEGRVGRLRPAIRTDSVPKVVPKMVPIFRAQNWDRATELQQQLCPFFGPIFGTTFCFPNAFLRAQFLIPGNCDLAVEQFPGE